MELRPAETLEIALSFSRSSSPLVLLRPWEELVVVDAAERRNYKVGGFGSTWFSILVHIKNMPMAYIG